MSPGRDQRDCRECQDSTGTDGRAYDAQAETSARAGPHSAASRRAADRVTAVDVVARLKEESEVPLRSHGSLTLDRALMAAGLVDRVQVTIIPVITAQTGKRAIFEGAADFDLEVIEQRTLDANIQELIYRPTRHV